MSYSTFKRHREYRQQDDRNRANLQATESQPAALQGTTSGQVTSGGDAMDLSEDEGGNGEQNSGDNFEGDWDAKLRLLEWG